MELKRYQKQIIADLSRYLDCLNETRSLPGAYRKFWNDAGVRTCAKIKQSRRNYRTGKNQRLRVEIT